jgi:hypothetical protein
MFGYTVDALSPYGTQRRLTFTDFVGGYSIQGGFGNTYLPTDEWLHVTWILDAPTGAGTHFYINGRYDGLGAAPILGGGAAMDSPIWIHGPSHGIWSWGDYALKDVRCYQGVLTATEVQYVYEHSLEFHRDSTPLVPQLIFQGAEGEPIPPEFTGQASAHHHILGAM